MDWPKSLKKLWDSIGGSVFTVLFRGLKNGTNNLPAGAAVAIDWDVVNERAVDYLNRYRMQWVESMVETTRKQSTRIIENWIRSGEPLDVLEKQMEQILGRERARRIAVTEVTRIYAEGNKIAWRDSGMVTGQRWNTAEDELVCPYCAPLDGKEVGLDSGFLSIGGVAVLNPPLHPNCRCTLSPVVNMDNVRSEIAKAING